MGIINSTVEDFTRKICADTATMTPVFGIGTDICINTSVCVVLSVVYQYRYLYRSWYQYHYLIPVSYTQHGQHSTVLMIIKYVTNTRWICFCIANL